MQIRTDLALESKSFYEKSSGTTGEVPGVSFFEKREAGYIITEINILNKQGEKELCKPEGKYITIEIEDHGFGQNAVLRNGQKIVADNLKKLFPKGGNERVLVCGLGNEKITPDSLGPRTARKVFATAHFIKDPHLLKGALHPVSVLETGVLGTTGLESQSLIKAVCSFYCPSLVLVIDALATGDISHVCRTVQLCDVGIVPGSGVGNDRKEISQKTLEVPVIAIGVPTVMDVCSLLQDSPGKESFDKYKNFYVTPKDIDSTMKDMSNLIGGGINLALQPGLSVEDLQTLTE